MPLPGTAAARKIFDLTGDLTAGAREIKRWLLRPEEPLRRASAHDIPGGVADCPGVVEMDAAAAAGFEVRCRADFEGIRRIDCRGRSRAGIVGDLGFAIGLPLPGTVEENRRALARRFREHRYLFVLENLAAPDRGLTGMGGLASFILTASPQVPVSLDDLAAAFFISPRDEYRCMDLLGAASAAVTRLLRGDFEAGLRLGWAMVGVLKSGQRFAEALEILDRMRQAADSRMDDLARFKIDWELSWMRDSPDGSAGILPTAGPEIAQLSLF